MKRRVLALFLSAALTLGLLTPALAAPDTEPTEIQAVTTQAAKTTGGEEFPASITVTTANLFFLNSNYSKDRTIVYLEFPSLPGDTWYLQMEGDTNRESLFRNYVTYDVPEEQAVAGPFTGSFTLYNAYSLEDATATYTGTISTWLAAERPATVSELNPEVTYADLGTSNLNLSLILPAGSEAGDVSVRLVPHGGDSPVAMTVSTANKPNLNATRTSDPRYDGLFTNTSTISYCDLRSLYAFLYWMQPVKDGASYDAQVWFDGAAAPAYTLENCVVGCQAPVVRNFYTQNPSTGSSSAVLSVNLSGGHVTQLTVTVKDGDGNVLGSTAGTSDLCRVTNSYGSNSGAEFTVQLSRPLEDGVTYTAEVALTDGGALKGETMRTFTAYNANGSLQSIYVPDPQYAHAILYGQGYEDGAFYKASLLQDNNELASCLVTAQDNKFDVEFRDSQGAVLPLTAGQNYQFQIATRDYQGNWNTYGSSQHFYANSFTPNDQTKITGGASFHVGVPTGWIRVPKDIANPVQDPAKLTLQVISLDGTAHSLNTTVNLINQSTSFYYDILGDMDKLPYGHYFFKLFYDGQEFLVDGENLYANSYPQPYRAPGLTVSIWTTSDDVAGFPYAYQRVWLYGTDTTHKVQVKLYDPLSGDSFLLDFSQHTQGSEYYEFTKADAQKSGMDLSRQYECLVLVDGIPMGSSNAGYFYPADQDGTVKYTATAQQAEHGALSLSAETGLYGTIVYVDAVGDAGYELKPGSITVNGKAILGRAFPLIEDCVVTAQFQKVAVETFEVTVDTNLYGGTVTADKSTAAEGETVTLTVTPETGRKLDTLYYRDKSYQQTNIDKTTRSFVMPGKPVTVCASFGYAQQYQIGIDQQIAFGSISVNGSTYGGLAYEESTVTVTVAPEEGYRLQSLCYYLGSYAEPQGEPVEVKNGSFVMPAQPIYLTAVFEEFTGYPVNTAAAVEGTAQTPDTADWIQAAPASAAQGDTVKVTVSPDLPFGYSLKEGSLGYREDGSDQIIPITDGSFVMPACAVTVVATFLYTSHTITLTPGEGYVYDVHTGGSPASVDVAHGDSFIFELVLGEDYRDSTPVVKLDGAVLTPVDYVGPNLCPQFRLDSVTADHTITVEGVMKNACKVKFIAYDTATTDYAVVSVAAGETLGDKMPKDPEREDFIFTGWATKDDAPFTADTVVDATLTVIGQWREKAGLTIDETAQTYAYDGQPHSFQITSNPEGLSGFEVHYNTAAGTVDQPVNAGVYSITVVREADQTYKRFKTYLTDALVITPAPAPAIVWPNAASQLVFGQKLSDSVLSGGDTTHGSFAWTEGSTSPEVGTHTFEVTFTPTDSINYDYSQVELTHTLEVTVAPLPIKGVVSLELYLDENENGVADPWDRLRATLMGLDPINAEQSLTYRWYNGDQPADNTAGGAYDVDADTYIVTGEETSISLEITASGNYTGTLRSQSYVPGTRLLMGSLRLKFQDLNTGDSLTAVADLGDALLDQDYTLQWYRDSLPLEGATGETYQLVQDDLGHTISVTAAAVEGGDYSGTAGSAPLVIPAQAPATPVLTAQAGVGQVVLTWDTPHPQGSPLQGYFLDIAQGQTPIAGSPFSLAADAVTYTANGLTPGQTYTFTLRAVNGVGASASRAVEATTGVPVPTQPVLTAQAGNRQVVLTWTAAESPDSPLRLYELIAMADGKEIEGSPFFTQPDVLTYTVTGLTNGTEYSFFLWAINDADGKVRTDTVTATPFSSGGGSSGGGGGGGGGSSQPDKPTTNPDGSTTTVTKNPDGSTTTQTVAPDGGKTTQITTKSGTTITASVPAGSGAAPTVHTAFKAEVKDGVVTASLPAADVDALAQAAKDSGAGIITIAPDLAASAQANAATVTLPTGAAATLAGVAGVAVNTPVGNATLPAPALSQLGSSAVSVSMTANGEGMYSFEVQSDGQPVERLAQEAKVTLPANQVTAGTVAVLILADGTQQILPKSAATADGVSALLAGSATLQLVDNSKFFSDVPAGSWAADAVAWATSRNLFSGVNETSFGPDVTMSRGMLVTVLHSLENKVNSGVDAGFADVDASAYYAGAVAWASQLEIVSGTGTGFDPDGQITREQLAVMLYRFAQTLGYDTGVHGAAGDDVSPWASQAMGWAVGCGLMQGDERGNLNPTASATRAQTATILQRFVEELLR